MKRLILIFVIFTLAVAAALVLFIYRRPAPRAVTLLPDSTLVFLDIPNFPRTRAAFRQTAAYALWQEPEVQAFLEQPVRAFNASVERPPAKPGEKDDWVEDILGLLQGEVFVAVTHLAPKTGLQTGLIIGADVKHKLLQAKVALARHEQHLHKWAPKATVTTKHHLGHEYHVWQMTPTAQICHSFFRSLVVFTFNEDALRTLIARGMGQALSDSPTLAGNKTYQAIVQRLPPGRELVAFINAEQIVGPLGLLSRQGAGTMQQLARIQAAATSVTFVDGNLEDVGITSYTKPAPKLPQTVTRDSLALTTTNTSFYCDQAFDFATLYQELLSAIPQLGNLAWSDNVARFDRKVRAREVRLREDVLANLGPETAFLGVWREGARNPDVALVTQIKDAAPTRPKLDAVLSVLKDTAVGNDDKFPWEEITYLGEKLRVARVGSAVIAPTYFVTGNYFVLALTTDYARELLAQLKSPKPTLAKNVDYFRATKRLPADVTSFTYCDTAAVFGQLYALWRASVSTTGTNQYFDATKLPQIATLTRHLGPYSSATVTEPLSETTTTYSPLGKPLTLLLAATAALNAAQPYLAELPELTSPFASTNAPPRCVPAPLP